MWLLRKELLNMGWNERGGSIGRVGWRDFPLGKNIALMIISVVSCSICPYSLWGNLSALGGSSQPVSPLPSGARLRSGPLFCTCVHGTEGECQGTRCRMQCLCLWCLLVCFIFTSENWNERECRSKELSDMQAQTVHVDTVLLSYKIYRGFKIKKRKKVWRKTQPVFPALE